MTLTVDLIRDCLEGVIPAAMATADERGMPNVSLLSQVHYVDPQRVALSYQFFNKTRRNVLATRAASVIVADPTSGSRYRLELDYETTETGGPLFESMRAKLAGIASHAGMAGVFRLLGSDIFRVRTIERLPGQTFAPTTAPRNLLSAVRRTFVEMAEAHDLGDLFDRTLAALWRHFAIGHSMILLFDETGERLYTVASRGYPRSGVGSEVALGEGVIGVAAREGAPIRIAHMTSEYGYGTAIRERARTEGMEWAEATEIPFPGLPSPESQIALPIASHRTTCGVLFAESLVPMRFWYDDEDALALVAERMGTLILDVQRQEGSGRAAMPPPPPPGRPIAVRHYAVDDSVFLDGEYLIKGVAGAIFWKLAREYVDQGRYEFTNREIRLDPAVRLPRHAENLEARLVLLQRRLAERGGTIRIEKTGRGRFRLCAPSGLTLEVLDSAVAV